MSSINNLTGKILEEAKGKKKNLLKKLKKMEKKY